MSTTGDWVWYWCGQGDGAICQLVEEAVPEPEPVSPCDWTTSAGAVTVEPPPASCCTTGWTDTECNVLQNAIDGAADGSTIKIKAGNYCNKGFHNNSGLGPNAEGKSINNGALLKIDGRKNLKLAGVKADGTWYRGNVDVNDLPQL